MSEPTHRQGVSPSTRSDSMPEHVTGWGYTADGGGWTAWVETNEASLKRTGGAWRFKTAQRRAIEARNQMAEELRP